jgi:very-short-patch-repair endonuclease
MSVGRRLDPPRDGEGDRRPKAGGGGGSEERATSLRRPTVYAARRLRRTMTLPERLLWQRLRGSPQGIAFRKQHAIDPYVADFYCAGPKLVIEIDGKVHNMGDRPERDETRTSFLEGRGYRLLRIPAEDILKDPDRVAASVVAYAADPLHHRAARGGPPPRPGEDLR